MPPFDVNTAFLALYELFKWLNKVHDDIPAEERRKFHERAGRIADFIWKNVEKQEPQS